jgi:hypothetical protein
MTQSGTVSVAVGGLDARLRKDNKMNTRRFHGIWFLLAVLNLGWLSTVRADSYRISVKADVEKGQLTGEMTLQYWNQGTASLEKLRLRLDPNLSPSASIAIRHVRTNESDDLTWRFLPFRFGRLHSEQGLIEIELPSPLAPHGKTEIQIGFEFSDKRMVNGNAIMLQDDPYHSLDAWYPKAMTRLGNDWSINDDRPSTYRITIELPATLAEVASTGKFVSRKLGETGSALVHLTADDVRGFTIYSSRP